MSGKYGGKWESDKELETLFTRIMAKESVQKNTKTTKLIYCERTFGLFSVLMSFLSTCLYLLLECTCMYSTSTSTSTCACAWVYICVCVCAWACARARANACVRKHMRTGLKMCEILHSSFVEMLLMCAGRCECPLAPMNHVKHLRAGRQYKSFPPDRFCHVEVKTPTILSNKTSNA